MKLISYLSTRPGFQGVGSWLVRQGTNSIFSHTEIVFMPGDGVDDLMPDRTTIPNEAGEFWCASATASDIMPSWSARRAGRRGGIRFKRIAISPNWMEQDITDIRNPVDVVNTFLRLEGLAYDWRHIAGFMGPLFNLAFSHSASKFTCTEVCATALGFPEPSRFHPGNLPPAIEFILSEDKAKAYASYADRVADAKRKHQNGKSE